MSKHRELVDYWFSKGWAEGDGSAAEEVFAEDFVLNGKKVGPAGPQRSIAVVHSAFSEVEVALDLVLTDGPYVVTHFTATARHTGGFRGFPATGRTVRVTGIVVWQVSGGKVVQDWNVLDTAGLVGQITDAQDGGGREQLDP
ncbi:ester cyclase [Streptomyces luteireticuli]|uniref:ester cyclase n=1 Tax=Streptomyces luteireticuli TaxID=173858 RepID=UPI0035579E8E